MKAKMIKESLQLSKITEKYIETISRCLAFDGDIEIGPETGNVCDIVYRSGYLTAAVIILHKGKGGSNIDLESLVILKGDRIYFSYMTYNNNHQNDVVYVAGNSDNVKSRLELQQDEEDQLIELTENIIVKFEGKRLTDSDTRETIETLINMYETLISRN